MHSKGFVILAALISTLALPAFAAVDGDVHEKEGATHSLEKKAQEREALTRQNDNDPSRSKNEAARIAIERDGALKSDLSAGARDEIAQKISGAVKARKTTFEARLQALKGKYSEKEIRPLVEQLFYEGQADSSLREKVISLALQRPDVAELMNKMMTAMAVADWRMFPTPEDKTNVHFKVETFLRHELSIIARLNPQEPLPHIVSTWFPNFLEVPLFALKNKKMAEAEQGIFGYLGAVAHSVTEYEIIANLYDPNAPISEKELKEAYPEIFKYVSPAEIQKIVPGLKVGLQERRSAQRKEALQRAVENVSASPTLEMAHRRYADMLKHLIPTLRLQGYPKTYLTKTAADPQGDYYGLYPSDNSGKGVHGQGSPQ